MNHFYVGRSRTNNKEINYVDTTCLIIMRFDVINFYSCYIFEMRKYLLIDRTSRRDSLKSRQADLEHGLALAPYRYRLFYDWDLVVEALPALCA